MKLFSPFHLLLGLCVGILFFPWSSFAERPAVSKNPGAEHLFQLGIQFLVENELEKAEKFLSESLSFDPTNGSIHWELGWLYWKRQNWEKVVEHWEQTQKYLPKVKGLPKYYAQAQAYLSEKQGRKPLRKQRKQGTFSLVAVGDTMLASNYPDEKKMPPNGGLELFEKVQPYLQGNLLFGNLEGTLSTVEESSKCKKYKVCYAFRTPPHYTHLLKENGFDVFSLANNHIRDFGEEGIQETIETLDQYGIQSFGPHTRETTIVNIQGWKVGFFGVSTTSCCVHINEWRRSARFVRNLKEKVDLVVVSFHAGAEGKEAAHVLGEKEYYYGEERGNVKAFAHSMIDAGADLLLGHGPHILRGMELYRGRLIAYSLGNFLGYLKFNTSENLKYSMILKATLAGSGELRKVEVVPLLLSEHVIPEFDPRGGSLSFLNQLSSKDFGKNGVILGKNGHWP